MATPRKWSGVAVAMQSALATAITITAITKASPAVVSYTGTDPSNGDYVLLAVQGMHQMDAKVVRVANVNGAGNTFEAEGIDSSAFDTFTSGTGQVVTLGTSVTTATNITASGGDFDFIDTTTIHNNVKTQIPGSANPAVYSLDNIWDVSDAGLVAMKLASDTAAQRVFKFTFGTGGQIMVFAGYVGCTLLPTGQAQQLVSTPSVITMFGTPTFYSS